MGEGWVRRLEEIGMGRSDAAIMGVVEAEVLGGEGCEAPCRIAFMMSFSKTSLYGTVCGE